MSRAMMKVEATWTSTLMAREEIEATPPRKDCLRKPEPALLSLKKEVVALMLARKSPRLVLS
jgi:hypothetical protein